jgi:hypothetical protein
LNYLFACKIISPKASYKMRTKKRNNKTHKLYKNKTIDIIVITAGIAQSVLRLATSDGSGSSPDRGKIFLISILSRPIRGLTHRPIQSVPRVLFPEVKQPGRMADNSPATGPEVKNAWMTAPYAFMA